MPSPAGRCLQPPGSYAAYLHVCIPPGKRNITPSTQGEERGGQTPGGVRVGLDFFGTFCIKAKSTIKKGATAGVSVPLCGPLGSIKSTELCLEGSKRNGHVKPTPYGIIHAWRLLSPPKRGSAGWLLLHLSAGVRTRRNSPLAFCCKYSALRVTCVYEIYLMVSGRG
jgi:hypothetical protein